MGIKKVALWVHPLFQKDVIFDRLSPLSRDGAFNPFVALKEAFLRKGWEIRTQDVYAAAGVIPDAVIFMDVPALPVDLLLGGWKGRTRKFAVLQECELIKPRSWDPRIQAGFDGVFTWADSLVDNKKFFKLNFPQTIPAEIPAELEKRSKLCVLIAGNKKRPHSLELYSKRVEAIRWFEAHHPDEFEFYGAGWDRFVFGGSLLLRALNRLRFLDHLRKRFAPVFPSYRGTVPAKLPILSRYRFSICYENARDIPGYITEKIFDCFFAGCIPVYWGAPDISLHVPEKCFIDRRKFASYEELYSYLRTMTNEQWLERLEAVRDFVSGPRMYPFSETCFAETIAGVVAGA